MPIKELQRRLTQVGVIRLGQQLMSKNNKPYPSKLETLRFTSPSKAIVEAAAAQFGGTVQPWTPPVGGPQFEVITDAREIRVLVPPQQIDPNYELWGNGFRSRMCDGETERISQKGCLCAPVRVAAEAAGRNLKPGEVCKPTTRMSLMVADIPSLGVFKLESHGWNAAAELPGLAEAVANAPRPIPALLEVQRREKKLFHPNKPANEQIESRVYMVPVVHYNIMTPAQAFSGQIGAAIAAAQRRELVAAQLAAIEAGPAADGPAGDGDKLTPADVVRLAPYTKTLDQLQALWKDAHKDKALTDDTVAVLKARAAELEMARQQPAQPSEEPAEGAPTAEAVEAVSGEVESEPDKNALWVQIQGIAGSRRWNAEALEKRIYDRFKRTSDEMTGWDMAAFISAVAKGEIQ
ncbi:hypothetical protein C1I95_25755 [Micromonospora craterilacus]|uniref:Uncharacterized protein n=1 Tax=Micromonospora craterilacus TaxID=1655439 RepID=A0A2W2DKJ4_9ACTN|nr:hypothetical protein [Micromonospora craterilacus]PZG12456.1 hypothetical protein C1I95_25755 [Micromonospora craterilacus]